MKHLEKKMMRYAALSLDFEKLVNRFFICFAKFLQHL